MNAFDEIKQAVPELTPTERQQLYELLREPVELAPGIFSTSGVCGGDACVRDFRLPVWQLEEARRLGGSEPELLASHPFLTVSDLQNAWAYVASNRAEIERCLRENAEAAGGL